MSKNLRVAVADAETDPFLYGRVPEPFTWGFYDGTEFRYFWGKDCTEQFLNFLRQYKEPCRIYFHNGGKFDFFFMLDAMQNPIKIIGSRIVSFQFEHHTFVDSWAIIPESLEKANAKTKIDYAIFEREERNEHRAEIVEYLSDDCYFLYELVSAFVEEFGPRLTIGGTAMRELRRLHRTKDCGPTHDAKFRAYYYGGRVQCFESGIVEGDFKLYDVNSMYPYVMATMDHPYGEEYIFSTDINAAVCSPLPFFAEFDGICADLPHRVKNSVEYNSEHAHFSVTGHELIACFELGLISRAKNWKIWQCVDSEKYDTFINHFNAKKVQAEIDGDKIHRSFYKRVNNSAYGRFAINPEKFKDYHIRKLGEGLPPKFLYAGAPACDYGAFEIWEAPSETGSYQDVAIGASITGAARSVLLRARYAAERPIYCDTDSLVCEGLKADLHNTRLGAWKEELAGIKLAAIAGKKLYALFDSENECMKYASKGCRISPEEIKRACLGEEIVYNQIAPNFSLRSAPSFLTRRIKSTS